MILSRDAKFKEKHAGHEFDRGLWKQFWYRNQRYHTVCLPCISIKNETERNHQNGDDVNSRSWGPVILTDTSRVILDSWYMTARENLFGAEGKSRDRVTIDVSDDEEDDMTDEWRRHRLALNNTSSSMAVYWLRSARARLQQQQGDST